MSTELFLIVFYLCAGVYTARHLVAAGFGRFPAVVMSGLWPVVVIGFLILWFVGYDESEGEDV